MLFFKIQYRIPHMKINLEELLYLFSKINYINYNNLLISLIPMNKRYYYLNSSSL